MDIVLNYENKHVRIAGTKEDPLFNGKDVCTILGIVNHRDALSTIDTDYKLIASTDSHGGKQKCIFINEFGLYELIFKSKKEEAKYFRKWVCKEVLPCIRKHGCYPYEPVIKNVDTQMKLYINTEFDLHTSVVKYIRDYLSNTFVIIAGLGGQQNTDELRLESYRLGYSAGQPDLILIAKNNKYSGIAIEMKTPKGTGVVTPSQEHILDQLKHNNFKVIVSNDYNQIIYKLTKYSTLLKQYKRLPITAV